ncbi:MAG: fibronectin type III domain-containing protein [Chloroflexota bacterium]|nr:fibronectin type III domain-containing protein [Chloroflexota bacterium]
MTVTVSDANVGDTLSAEYKLLSGATCDATTYGAGAGAGAGETITLTDTPDATDGNIRQGTVTLDSESANAKYVCVAASDGLTTAYGPSAQISGIDTTPPTISDFSNQLNPPVERALTSVRFDDGGSGVAKVGFAFIDLDATCDQDAVGTLIISNVVIHVRSIEGGSAGKNFCIYVEDAAGNSATLAAGPIAARATALPAKPTGYTATAGDTQVTLSWTDPSDASITGWQYRQKAGSGEYGNWTEIPNSRASTTRHTVTKLANGTSYTFQVRAMNTFNAPGGVGGPASDEESATPLGAIPAKPAGFTATAGDKQVTLSWTDPGNASITKWQYRRKAGSGEYGAWTDVPNGGATTTTHTVTDLINGTSYAFQVRAINASGDGAASEEATATPNAVPLLTVGSVPGGPAQSKDVVVTVADTDSGDTLRAEYRLLSGANCDATTYGAGETVTLADTPDATDGNTRQGTVTLDSESANDMYICIKADDGLATVFGPSAQISGIDTTAPAISFADVTPAEGSTYTVTFTDAGSKVAKYGISVIDSGATCNQSAAGALTTVDPAESSREVAFAVPSGSTGNLICAFVEDAAGNSTSLRDSAEIAGPASAAPVISIAAPVPSGWATSKSVTVTVSDANVGDTLSAEYKLLSGATCDATTYGAGAGAGAGETITLTDTPDATDGNIRQGTVTLDSESANAKYVCVAASDGLTTAYGPSAQISGIDTTPPTISDFSNQLNPPVERALTSVRFDDGGSGVAKVGFAFIDLDATCDQDAVGTLIISNVVIHVRSIEGGSAGKNFCIYVEDAVGNAATMTAGPIAARATALPAKPVGFTATAGDTQVTLRWTDPSDNTIIRWQYRQKAGSGEYGNWTEIPNSRGGTTRHTVTNLINGTMYTFQVRAVNTFNAPGGVGGPASDEESATPATPLTIECSNTTATPSSSSPGLVSDCETLLAAKETLLGTVSPTALNWSVDTAIADWTGVTVSGGRVTGLRLRVSVLGVRLNGTIPVGLASLSALQRLNLTANALTGSIPRELGDLTNLTDLLLSNNQLRGSIPPELGQLANLEVLDLSSNALTGSIPTQLGNLTDLTVLDLSANGRIDAYGLSGSIPTQLGALTKLETLNLSVNKLSGSIPTQLGALTKLTTLDLFENDLSGTIPAQLKTLTKLETLGLRNNDLSGAIPSDLVPVNCDTPAGASGLCAMDDLDLRGNALTGTVTVTLSPADNMREGDARNVTVTVTLDAATKWANSFSFVSHPTRVTLNVTGSGEAGAVDFTNSKDTLVIQVPRGDASATETFTLGTTANRIDENDETVSVSVDGAKSSAAAFVADLRLSGAAATILIEDDDDRGIFRSVSSLTVPEHGEARYSLRLNSQPTHTVTVTLTKAPGGSEDITFSPATLTFTTTDWDMFQEVTVSAARDADSVGDTAIINHDAAGGDYSGLSDGGFFVAVSDTYAAPAAPTLTSAQGLPSKVRLIWTHLGDDTITKWQYSSDDGATWIDIPDSDSSTRSHDVAGLDAGTSYTFKVRACNDFCGAASGTLSATPGSAISCLDTTATPSGSSADLVKDCETLLAARDDLRGTATLNWSVNTAMDGWEGVAIRDGRVTRLNLANKSLTGKIPAELGDLSALEDLNLGDNALTGTLPSALAKLGNLELLYLQNNRLTGGIPAAYAALDLERLYHLNLNGNNLTGTVTLTLAIAGGATQLTEGGGTQTVIVTAKLDPGTAWAHMRGYKSSLTVTVAGSGGTGVVGFGAVSDFDLNIDTGDPGFYGEGSAQFDLTPVVDSGTQASETLTVRATGTGALNVAEIALTSNSPTLTLVDGTSANAAPRFSSTETIRMVAENSAAGTRIGDPVAATDVDGDTLTYTVIANDSNALTGDATELFDIDVNTGQLRVKAALDYEAGNHGTNNVHYTFTISVSDGKDAAGDAETAIDDTITVTVWVTDVDEPGAAGISSGAPQVGKEIIVWWSDADYIGPDDYNLQVQWERLDAPDSTDGEIIAGATEGVYTPVAADEGKWLRVTFTYDDVHGDDKEVSAVTANAVAAQ